MIPNPPKDPQLQVETLFALWIESLALSPLISIPIYNSSSTGQKKLPCLISFCEEATQLMPTRPIYEATLFFYVETQKDDETVTTHDLRLGAVRKAMLDGNAGKGFQTGMPGITQGILAAQQFMNYQGGDPTSPPIPGFRLDGFYEEKGEQNDRQRHFGNHLRYHIAFKAAFC